MLLTALKHNDLKNKTNLVNLRTITLLRTIETHFGDVLYSQNFGKCSTKFEFNISKNGKDFGNHQITEDTLF